jgi:hypothetical protein
MLNKMEQIHDLAQESFHWSATIESVLIRLAQAWGLQKARLYTEKNLYFTHTWYLQGFCSSAGSVTFRFKLDASSTNLEPEFILGSKHVIMAKFPATLAGLQKAVEWLAWQGPGLFS